MLWRDGRADRVFQMFQKATRRSLLAGSVALVAAACGGGDDPEPAVPELPATNTPEPVSTQPPIGSPVAGYGDPERWAGRNLNIAAWGGDIEVAQVTAYFDPFEEATSVDIQIQTADLERLVAQI